MSLRRKPNFIMQKKLSLILSDTKRSLTYLNYLNKNKINIKVVLFYGISKKKNLFKKILKSKNIDTILFKKTKNINSKSIEMTNKYFSNEYILFSGYPGQIIKNKKLLNKNLIHCHPGLLPKYKGSTTIYYSLLNENKIFVSLFRVSKKIDSGKILFISKVKAPNSLSLIENQFDNKVRAETLIKFINSKKKITIKKKPIVIFKIIILPTLL